MIISHGQLGHVGTAYPRLLTTAHVAAVASAPGLIGAWPASLTSRSLVDFGTEIIRLTEVAGPGHLAIGTDLDGNYRPVLTSYHQLADLAGLLRDRGLRAAQIRQILGGNATELLNPHRTVNAGRAQRRAGALCAGCPAGFRSERMEPASGLDATKFREWARCRAPR